MRPFLLFVFALAVLAGCDAFGEPERFYNDDARPPTVGGLDLAQLRDGQHVAGELVLSLNLDSLAGRVDRVALWIDGEEVEARTQPPFRFRVYTPSYPEGAHTVSAAVHVRQPNGGLLNLADAPAVILGARLVFDQRPPTPVALTSVELEGDRARLRWAASADANFYAYLVVRRAPWTVTAGGSAWQPVVDTLYDRAATSWLDAPLPHVYGARADYDVLVWNRAEVSESAGSLSAAFGTLVPSFQAIRDARAATSPDGSEVYVVTGSRLVAVSSQSGAELRSLDLPELAGSYGATSDLHLDLGLLYVASGYSGEKTLRVIQPSTFSEVARYALPFGAAQFVVRDARLYAAGGGRGEAQLHVIEAATGAVLARATVGIRWSAAQVAGISPDGRSVYVMDEVNSREVLARVDVSGEQPLGAERQPLGYGPLWALAVAPDGRVFAHSGGDVDVLSPTLQRLGTISPRGADGAIPVAVQIARGHLYVAHTGEVAEYDLESLAKRRTWAFASGPSGLVVGSSSMAVFAREGGWLISL